MAEANGTDKELVYRVRDAELGQQDEGYHYARVALTLPVGVAFDDLLKPEAWAQVAHRFHKNPNTNEPDRRGTIITVRTVDHAFYAEMYVRAVGERDLEVECIGPAVDSKTGQPRPQFFGPPAAMEGGRYEVRWNVGKRGFDVIRRKDREIIAGAEKFQTREKAMQWVAELEGQSKAA
jgi:hypothetical protein